MSNPPPSRGTYGEAVGMYALSRLQPRQHLIDDLAEQVTNAGSIGALVFDDRLDYDAMEAAWAKGHSEGFHAALRNIVRVAVGLSPDDPDGRWSDE